ncbi:hypothetical protein HAX54_015116, partial [Datura stramonium]|nr:hypothetical protein [Datura stramonium]
GWTVLLKVGSSFELSLEFGFRLASGCPLIDEPPSGEMVSPLLRSLTLEVFQPLIHLLNDGPSFKNMVRPLPCRFPITWEWFLDHTGSSRLLKV